MWQLQRKNLWCLELVILILIINLASAIEVNSPEKVTCKESFKVSVINSGVYDVKIDILAEGKRIARIFDKNWKSTFYYIKNLSENQDFLLNITEDYTGTADMNISIKIGSKITKIGKIIEIECGKKEVKEEKEKEEAEEIPKIIQDAPNVEIKENNEANETIEKDIKSQNNTEFKSKMQYIKEYALVSFSLLSLILIIVIWITSWKYTQVLF